MDEPFFSVIIPIYQVRRDFFTQCVESVLRQTFSDFQLILTDDGNPDLCGKWCDEFAKQDSRIQVLHRENGGVSAARNSALETAEGRWVLFLDADDWLEEEACEKLYDYLSKMDCDMLLFRSAREKSNGTSTVIDYGLQFNHAYRMSCAQDCELLYRKAMQPSGILRDSVSKDTFYYVWNKVFKREFLCNHHITFPVGLPNSEDKVFVLNCLRYAGVIYSVSDCLHHYRILETSATRNYSETADGDRIRLLTLIKPLAQEMDCHLCEISGQNDVRVMESDYTLFVYMMSSNVLLRKYYHPQYPSRGRSRKRAAAAVLCNEPFDSAIKAVRKEKLCTKEKIRSWLLFHKFYAWFALLFRIRSRFS